MTDQAALRRPRVFDVVQRLDSLLDHSPRDCDPSRALYAHTIQLRCRARSHCEGLWRGRGIVASEWLRFLGCCVARAVVIESIRSRSTLDLLWSLRGRYTNNHHSKKVLTMLSFAGEARAAPALSKVKTLVISTENIHPYTREIALPR